MSLRLWPGGGGGGGGETRQRSTWSPPLLQPWRRGGRTSAALTSFVVTADCTSERSPSMDAAPPHPSYDLVNPSQSPLFVPSLAFPISEQPSSSRHPPSSSSWRHHPYSESTSASRSLRSRSRSTASASSARSDRNYSEELLSDASEDFDGQGMADDSDYLPFLPTSAPTPSPLLSFPSLPPLPPPSPATKPKASHARKTAPGHIKRPPNAFILFRSHCCSSTPSEDPDDPPAPSAAQIAELGITDHRHISRITSHLWKSLPRAEKGYWERKALAKKAEHLRLHPDYKYKPVYRKKEEVRRKKKVEQEEMDEEKRGCEEVAKALLNPLWVAESERENEEEPAKLDNEGRRWEDETTSVKGGNVRERTGQRWTIATVVQALADDQDASLPPPPPLKVKKRKKGQLRSRAKTAGNKQAASSPQEIPSSASSATSSSSMSSQFDFDVPYSSAEEPFRPHTAPVGLPIPYASRRRTSHARTQTRSYDDNPFSYMALLDNHASLFAQGPALHESGFDSRPHTSSSTFDAPHSAPLHTRRGPPAPLNLPYNPSFGFYPSVEPHSPYTPPDPAGSLDPLSQLHSYSLPTSSAPPPPPVATQRSSTPPYFFDPLPPAGMKRRGTIERTTGGGDLMLISPTADDFGTAGRKFSMGRWEAHDGGPLSAFEFDPDFLQSVMLGTQRIDGKSYASWDPRGSICGGRRRSGVDPGWTGGAEGYHVGGTEFFSAPTSALPLDARQPCPNSAPSPSFGSVAFGNSFQPSYASHRPSIDALLSSSVPHFSAYGELAASQPWVTRTRGSDATLRGSISGVGREARMAADREAKRLVEAQSGGTLRGEEGSEGGAHFIYLTKEQAEDGVLVQQILSCVSPFFTSSRTLLMLLCTQIWVRSIVRSSTWGRTARRSVPPAGRGAASRTPSSRRLHLIPPLLNLYSSPPIVSRYPRIRS